MLENHLARASGRNKKRGVCMFEFATKFIVDPDKWLTDVWTQVTAANLPEIVRALGFGLLIIGAVWGGYRIASLGATSELQPFLIRLLLGTMLLFYSPQIGNSVRDLWSMGHRWGTENFVKKTTDQANTELGNLRNTMLGLSAGILAAPIIIEGGKTLLGKNGGDAMKDAKEGVVNNGKIILELVKYVVGGLAAIITTMYMIVIVTGFAAILASILIPFSGVMLLFPGPALQMWFSMWFRATSGAILIVMLSPIAFSAALTLGFIEPAKNYNAALEKSASEFQGATGILSSFTPSLSANPMDAVKYIQTAGPRLEAAAKQLGNSLGTLSFGMVSSIIMLFVGIAFAVLLIFAAQSQIIAFVGGAAGGGGGLSTSPLATAGALAAGGLATTVGMGGRSSNGRGDDNSKGAPNRPDTNPGGGAPSRPDNTPSGSGGSGGSGGSDGGGRTSTFRTTGNLRSGGNDSVGSGGGGGSRPSGSGFGSSTLQGSSSSRSTATNRSPGFGSGPARRR
jgi:hypothetical protein